MLFIQRLYIHHSRGVLKCLVFVDVPLLVEIDELEKELVQSILCLHLHVHGEEKGEKKEYPANEGDYFGFSQLGAIGWIQAVAAIVSEAHDDQHRTGNHHGYREEEKCVQNLVPS